MMRSASSSTRRRAWASMTTMANSSPPIRPTCPSLPTSSTSRLATARRTASPLGWPKVSLTGLKPSRSRNRIAHGTLPAVAARSASPSNWRTRPRLGRPDRTSTLARWVSRSWVWRISVMSEPTPRKPSKRPAVSMIGSPAIEIQRSPRAVLSSISSELNGCFSSSSRPSSALPPRSEGSEWPSNWLAGRPIRALIRERDVGNAIFGIDLPQPADAALLIFLKQQARAFALGAEVGVGLQLVKRPARHCQDAENRHSEGEQDGQHVRKRNGVAPEKEGDADAAGEGRHPGGDASRDDDQAERTDAKAGHQSKRR